MPQLITVGGYAGAVPENIEEVDVRVSADLDRMFPGGWHRRYVERDPEVRDARSARFEYHLFMPRVVKCHNAAVPAAQAYVTAARLAARAVAAADQAYAELGLSTTINWLAAHHRFVTLSIEARRLLAEVVDTATALRDSEFRREMAGLGLKYYEQHVPAGDRIAVPDVDRVELELVAFVESTRDRIDVLRATVSGGFPAGFAPAPTEPVPAPPAPEQTGLSQDDWDADADWPASHAVVAGREQRW